MVRLSGIAGLAARESTHHRHRRHHILERLPPAIRKSLFPRPATLPINYLALFDSPCLLSADRGHCCPKRKLYRLSHEKVCSSRSSASNTSDPRRIYSFSTSSKSCRDQQQFVRFTRGLRMPARSEQAGPGGL